MKNLQLSLKKKWFDMTDPNGKPEDYREINPYWISRLTNLMFDKKFLPIDMVYDSLKKSNKDEVCFYFEGHFKPFTQNTMTLGYPKKGDKERTKVFEHAGIEVRTGNPEWGAEPGKLYFVIKHGEII